MQICKKKKEKKIIYILDFLNKILKSYKLNGVDAFFIVVITMFFSKELIPFEFFVYIYKKLL